MPDTWLIPDRAELRPDDRGEFDELVVYDEAKKCVVHAEMMDDKTLWMRIELPGHEDGVVLWISSRGKLKIRAEAD